MLCSLLFVGHLHTKQYENTTIFRLHWIVFRRSQTKYDSRKFDSGRWKCDDNQPEMIQNSIFCFFFHYYMFFREYVVQEMESLLKKRSKLTSAVKIV